MPKRHKLLLAAFAAIAVGALLAFGLASSRAPALGRLAPALPRERLTGPPPGATARPVVVVFWASWCEPCAREAPALERFSQSPSGRGRLVGVDWSDALSGARSFIRRHGWTFSNLRDAEGTVGNDYRITGLPTTFVIDAAGRIRAVLRGPQDERSLAQALARVARS
jgi:cytochrome c biogenesis protein CcmG, thiol:disulfide interchange protein DsbE